jgi:hypothetical protein
MHASMRATSVELADDKAAIDHGPHTLSVLIFQIAIKPGD